MSESVDPLESRPFEASLDYNISDRVAGRKQVAENMASATHEAKEPPNPEPESGAEPSAPKIDKQEPEEPYSLWDERRKLGFMFGRVYITIMVVFLGVLSIYWGSLYRREDRIRNMKMLVVIEDQNLQLSNSSTVLAPLGQAFSHFLGVSRVFGDFEMANISELNNTANSNNATVFDELSRMIYLQEYWAGFYINSTASQVVYDLLISGNSLSVYALELQYLVTAIYESGRHFSALSQYVTKNLRLMEIIWLSYYAPRVYSNMTQYYLTNDQRQNLAEVSNSTQVPSPMSILPPFNMVDQRPSLSPAALGPSELGLIYAQIFSFHQFNFSVDLHNSIRDKLRFRHYATYRVMFSQLNHLVLALVYSLMTLAFQVPIDLAYGGPGFLILWITMYLFISASGGINECVVSIILYKDKKALLAPFMIFFIVINISPTFAPFVLSPGFYKYGYAMPMYNAYEALKVLFFNTWRGPLGRCYGILGAWVAVSNIVLVAILKYISDQSKKLSTKTEKTEKDHSNESR